MLLIHLGSTQCVTSNHSDVFTWYVLYGEIKGKLIEPYGRLVLYSLVPIHWVLWPSP